MGRSIGGITWSNSTRATDVLGEEAAGLLEHECKTIPRDRLCPPGPDFVDRIFAASDRNNHVLANLQRIYGHGRLAGTGYFSTLPVDQGIEHTAGTSFAPNPDYFDPENIIRLAIEGGCNAVASTLGVMGIMARNYAHRISFTVKINYNELLTYPNKYDQRLFASVDQAYELGAAAVEPASLGDSIYFAFITALPVGDGDLVPAAALGKTISIITGLLGWVLFGKIVGVSTRTVMVIMHPDEFER